MKLYFTADDAVLLKSKDWILVACEFPFRNMNILVDVDLTHYDVDPMHIGGLFHVKPKKA